MSDGDEPRTGDASAVEDLQPKRFQVLRYLYDDAQSIPAGQRQSLPAERIAIALNLKPAERSLIEQYLIARGLVELVAMGPRLAITTAGVEYVEQIAPRA
jgi:hypothetical protein